MPALRQGTTGQILLCWGMALAFTAGAGAQSLLRTEPERDFLNYGQAPGYENYAVQSYTPYPVFGFEAPRYDRLGNGLIAPPCQDLPINWAGGTGKNNLRLRVNLF